MSTFFPRRRTTSAFGGIGSLRVRGGLRNKPLDDSHNPFKRSNVRPGGPAGRADEEQKLWSCTWQEPYVQKCLGPTKRDGTRRVKVVKVRKDWKKKYNNERYTPHLRKTGAPKFANTTQTMYDYHPSKAPKRPKKEKVAKKATPKKRASKTATPKKAPVATKAPAKKTKAEVAKRVAPKVRKKVPA